MRTAALSAGAYGMVISGAGPTLLALADSAQATEVATAMADAWKSFGVTASVLELLLDTEGAFLE